MTAAAFQATFADWRLIRTRKVVQVVLELPLEQADQAYRVLGGMPDPGKTVWCAVARLENGALHEAPREELEPEAKQVSVPPARRRFNTLPLPQQAGLLCQDRVFWAFLREHKGQPKGTDDEACEDLAADWIRWQCGIQSRSELGKDNTKANKAFVTIRTEFEEWKLQDAIS